VGRDPQRTTLILNDIHVALRAPATKTVAAGLNPKAAIFFC
jgi:hypothetical protein